MNRWNIQPHIMPQHIAHTGTPVISSIFPFFHHIKTNYANNEWDTLRQIIINKYTCDKKADLNFHHSFAVWFVVFNHSYICFTPAPNRLQVIGRLTFPYSIPLHQCRDISRFKCASANRRLWRCGSGSNGHFTTVWRYTEQRKMPNNWHKHLA